jgi:hypothetical protein
MASFDERDRVELIPVSARGLWERGPFLVCDQNGEEPRKLYLRLQMLDPNPVQAEGANGSIEKQRHNNTFMVNGTSAGFLPFDLQLGFQLRR